VYVTELGFGTAPIAGLYQAATDEQARQSIDAAWDGGIRYFDTAPHYGLGVGERRLGAALGGRPRNEYVVSTKVGRLLAPNPTPTGSDLAAGGFDVPDDLTRVRDYSADGVRRSLAASLRRLGLDRVDIVLVHDPDDHVDQAIGEAVPALVRLREEGVVGAIGVGMNQWQAPLRAVRESDVDVVMVAGRWTLLDRSARPLLDECAERGVSVLAAAPFNSGLLARERPADGATFDYGPASADLIAAAVRWADRATEHGGDLPQAALQFPLRHAAVTAVVAGLRGPDQVRQAVSRLPRPFPPAFWAAADA
jgi:D-threo-aldose 1-dehydrogenase